METSYNNKYQLWSPPLLDLSLDSFSNDLISEFDKTRTNTSDNNENENKKSNGDIIKTTESTVSDLPISVEHQENPTELSLEVHKNHDHQQNSSLSSSSVTLPPSEREVSFHGEDASATANLFRKSSTFLKKKLSQNSKKGDRNSTISLTTTNNVEEISNIVSRQYPPKPLQYSPVVEPPSDNIQIISDNEVVETTSMPVAPVGNNSVPRNSRVASISDGIEKSGNYNDRSKRISDPTSAVGTSTATSTKTKAAAPKRRLFFSLRFC